MNPGHHVETLTQETVGTYWSEVTIPGTNIKYLLKNINFADNFDEKVDLNCSCVLSIEFQNTLSSNSYLTENKKNI